VLPLGVAEGIALIPYRPLAGGLLTGRYRQCAPPPPGTRLALDADYAQVVTERAFATVEWLREFANGYGHPLLARGISWFAGRPAVPP
jgi:1-deoxyxylulose-5-phosphate synthase